MVTQDELMFFVREHVKNALQKNRIVLGYEQVAKSLKLAESWPGVGDVETQDYQEVDIVALFVDMRGSSARALEIGDQKTFATMHAYLPAMHLLVSEVGGFVVRYTGDGLMALFGLGAEEIGPATSQAVHAALRMRDGIRYAVNPVLADYQIPDIACGWGVEAGRAVVTKLAMPGHAQYETMWETTAYGPAINLAAHLADDATADEILLGSEAERMWPKSPSGIGYSWKTSGVYQVDPQQLQRRLGR